MPQRPPQKTQPPRAVSKDSAKAVLVYFPEAVVTAVDRIVVSEDTDRSKWIRKAIREALQRRNVSA
jgi:metal-responsive CopG/Arc/MetJ family transcriptional regulator